MSTELENLSLEELKTLSHLLHDLKTPGEPITPGVPIMQRLLLAELFRRCELQIAGETREPPRITVDTLEKFAVPEAWLTSSDRRYHTNSARDCSNRAFDAWMHNELRIYNCDQHGHVWSLEARVEALRVKRANYSLVVLGLVCYDRSTDPK